MIRLSLCAETCGETVVLDMSVYGITHGHTIILGFQELDRRIVSKDPVQSADPMHDDDSSGDDDGGGDLQICAPIVREQGVGCGSNGGSSSGQSSVRSHPTTVSVSSRGSKVTLHSVVSSRLQSGVSIAEVKIALRKRDLGAMLAEDPELHHIMRWREYAIDPAQLEDDVAPVGAGTFGEVTARWFGATRVAVKTLKLSARKRALQQQRREIGMLFRLRHPHILTFIGAVAYDSTTATQIVTELCLGGSAYDRIFIHKDMTFAAGLTISIQVVQAIDYIHSLHIQHRDVKPGNIFLASRQLSQPLAKLGDFGLSRVEGSDGTQTPSLGTPGYIAPEVHQGQYGTAADIFALGVCIFEVVMRKHAFPVSQVNDYFRQKEQARELPDRLATSVADDGGKSISPRAFRMALVDMLRHGVRPPLDSAERELPGVSDVLGRCWDNDSSMRRAHGESWCNFF